MKRLIGNRLVTPAVFVLFAAGLFAQSSAPKLQYVVVLGRHGVRSPTAKLDDLKQYSTEPWPDFGAPPGELTPHGRKLMTVLGGWYRSWLDAGGLLPAGCDAARFIYLRGDVGQRTSESGRAFVEGLAPGCDVELHRAAEDPDPLFHSSAAGLVKGDGKLSAAAVSGRVGNNPAELAKVYAPAFAVLSRVLGKDALSALPTSIAPTDDGLADIRGPLRTGSTLAENLLLEYADGLTGNNLGWGRLNASNLNEAMAIHTAYADLARRTSYLARLQGANLLQCILRSIAQSISGRAVEGALGKPSDRLLILAAHDTNISHIAGILDLSWLLPGYQRDDTPPGGALVFRVWKRDADYFVDLSFIAQTLDQMHNSSPLTPASPPALAPVFVPGCSASALSYPCAWPAFQALASTL